MQLVPRLIQDKIEKRLFKGKVIILYGARQVGKTTLVKEILEKHKDKSLYLNCELLSVKKALSVPEAKEIKSYLGNNKLIVLDEAQKVKNIGSILKIIVDTYPEIQIIATGSSSFDLANETSEPLTGRVDKFILYPFSIEEISKYFGRLEVEERFEALLRFGSYPEIFFLSEEEAKNRLDEIASNYLYKDILSFEGLKNSDLLIDLLQLLALQLGNEVSYHELATQMGVSRATIKKYINLLEKSFVVFSLRSFSRNPRKEISKSVKIYFYDLGIRNSLIQNYNRPSLRNDKGALFENLMIIERMKRNKQHQIHTNTYFWRTYSRQEIDYVEERGGKIYAYEFKWAKGEVKKPSTFLKFYPESEFHLVDKNNYFDFVA